MRGWRWGLRCLSVGLCLLAGVAVASPTPVAGAPTPGTWEHLSTEDGITVWRLTVPGQDLPGFRGQVVIDATIAEIVAVMTKSEDHTKWMYKCKESKVLRELSPSHAIIYNRVEAPWPVSDRDIVMDTTVTYNETRTAVTMLFKNLRGDAASRYHKPVEGVVRMPRLVGFYKMWENNGKTKVLYEAESDIGGSIPLWLVNLASKDLPHITLDRLRRRVMDTKNGKLRD